MQPSSKLIVPFRSKNTFLKAAGYGDFCQNFFMKTILTALLFASLTLTSYSQTDPALSQRLDSVLEATRVFNVDKILDYTYPKLFTLFPREQMKEVLKSSFDNEVMTITLDSLIVDKIFPVFTIGDGSYTRVDHKQLMIMKFKEKIEAADKEATDAIIAEMETDFGKGNVRLDLPNNSIRIQDKASLIAAKDSHSKEWSFINLEDDDKIMPRLFSSEVIKKIREYK